MVAIIRAEPKKTTVLRSLENLAWKAEKQLRKDNRLKEIAVTSTEMVPFSVLLKKMKDGSCNM